MDAGSRRLRARAEEQLSLRGAGAENGQYVETGPGPCRGDAVILAILTARSSICRRIPVRMAATQAGVVLPTRVRFGVLYFGIALAVIQYIDRVCISWSMPACSDAAADRQDQKSDWT